MEEEWKDIYYFNKSTNEWIDYRGIYQVSNLGRIRSVDRYVRGYNHGKEHQKLIKGKILNCRPNRNGYILAHLAKEGQHRDYSLHRLIYFSFNPNADTMLQVNHIDENITNNNLANLNLLSAADNSNWGTRNKRISKQLKGRNTWTKGRKHTEEEILKMKLNNKSHLMGKPIYAIVISTGEKEYYNSIKEASKMLNMKSATSISCVLNGSRKTAYDRYWCYQ